MDPGRGYGCCEQRCVSFRRGIPDLHRDQAIVERFDRTLPKRLSGFHIAREMQLLLARGPLTGWYGCLWLYRHDFLDGKNAFSCCQGKNSGKKALLSGCWPPSWPRGEKAPLGCWCSLSLPPWQARRGIPQGNRTIVFFTGLQVKARGPQARRAGALLFVGWAD